MARFLAILVSCGLLAGACGGDDGAATDTALAADPGPGGADTAADTSPGPDAPGEDAPPTDTSGGTALVGSCLAHVTTQCVEFSLPAGAPTDELDIERTWCTGPKVWADAPCPTTGLLATCTVPPVEGVNHVTTRYLYYGAALLAGAEVTCAGYPGSTWTTP